MTSDGGDLWRPDPPQEEGEQRPRHAGSGTPPSRDPRHGQPPEDPRHEPGPGRPPQPPQSPQAGDPRIDPRQRPQMPPPYREQQGDPRQRPQQPGPSPTGDPRQRPQQPGQFDRGQRPPQQTPGQDRHRNREQYAAPQDPYAGQRDQRPPQPPRRPQQPGQHAAPGAQAYDPRQSNRPTPPPPPPPDRDRRPVDDNRALFRDEVPGRGGPAAQPQPSWQDQRPEAARERDWRDDYEEAVSATRWDLSPIPSMPVAPRRANPSNLEALIPPRRGRVQGPATRHPGGPAGTGPGTREGVPPWEAGLREREAAPPRPAVEPKAEPSVSRSSRLMAMGTMASRATGLIRAFMIVATLGTDKLGDAYNAGNNLPNIIYILVLGGALNAVFVPQLVRSMNRDRDGGSAYASRLVTLTVVSLLALSVLAVLAAPQLVDVFTDLNGTDRNAAIVFARLCLPQIFFYGVFVILGQILNAQGRFGPMMWTPVLANVVTIAAFGAYWWIQRDYLNSSTISPALMRLVGIGTTLGIAVQTLTLIPYIRATGIRLRPRFDWRGTGLGKTATLAKWTVMFVLVNQVGLLVVMRYATSKNIPEGWGLAAYNNAFMIWGLPQAIITVSVITALLPRMSRAAADSDLTAVRDDISYGLRVTGVAIVPAAFAFLALGPQIAVVLYFHGTVPLGNAHVIGYMLMAFGLGLIPFSAQFLMLRGFYAFEDTKSPFTINIWIAVVNVVLSSAVYYGLKGTSGERWSVVIMCAVYGVAYCVGLAITVAKLKRRLRGIDGRRITRTYVRLISASAVAGAGAFIVALYVNRMVGQNLLGAFAALVAGGGLLGVLFLVCSRLMRVEEVEQLIGSVRAKLGR